MSQFLSPLVLREDAPMDGGEWVLAEDLVYWSDIAGLIRVQAGFQTDLASVPRLPVIYLLAGGTADAAAVIHDYLYSTRELDRETADAVLREASATSGVPAWRRWIMWAAVRAFGGAYWTRREAEQDGQHV